MLERHRGVPLRVFVVWEPVLPTDWTAPSTATMRRISDPRVQQYWDKHRLLSKAMGERSRSSIVWDHVAIYSPNTVWRTSPPRPIFEDGPVVRIIPAFTTALERAIGAAPLSRAAS